MERTVRLYPPAVFREEVNMRKLERKYEYCEHKAGEDVDFVSIDDVVEFAGVKFGFEDKIRVTLGRDFDEREAITSAFEKKYGRGSWGDFGYSEEAIIDMAVKIVDLRTMETLYEGPCTSEPWDLSNDWYLIEHFGVKPSERTRREMARRKAQERKRERR